MAYTATQKKADFSATFGSDHGERVLNDMMKRFNMLGTTHVIGDANHAAFLEGQRDVMLYILKCLKCKPREVPAMVQRMTEDE